MLPERGDYNNSVEEGEDDGDGEYEETQDSFEAPQDSFRCGGGQEEHEETGQKIEARRRKEN